MRRLEDRLLEWRGNGLQVEANSLVTSLVEHSYPGSPAHWLTSWLGAASVLDRKGYVRHDGGVAEHPGMYLMGMQFLRRRKSSLIDGAGDDARDLSDHLASYLRQNSIG